jgi:hypothetical protein
MKLLGTVAFFCVVLLVSSVTAVPAVAAVHGETQVKIAQDTYAAEMEAMIADGTPLDLARLSNMSVFKDAHIAGIDVTVSSSEAVPHDDSVGLFTLHTAPHLPGVLHDTPVVSDDPAVQYFVANVTKVGYRYTGASTSIVVSKIKVADKTAMTPLQIAKAGLRWSGDEPNTLIGQSRLTNYTYTYPATGSQVNVQVLQPTAADGTPTGPTGFAVSPVMGEDGTTVEYRTVVEALIGSAFTGVVAGFVVYGVWGAGMTAEAAGLLTGAAAGLSVAACAAIGVGVFLALLVIWIIVWYCWFYDAGPAAYFASYPDDPKTRSAVHNTDGAIVYDDGSVAFLVEPVPPPLPEVGRPWVQATRTAAINTKGELWVLTNNQWTNQVSEYVYTDLEASGSWFAMVAQDASGTTHLEIPTVGSALLAKGSDIQRDVDLLNRGIDPKTKKSITPAVPGWKAFVPGGETSWRGPYGLALATDDRVFGVGSNRDGQCDLPGRYTKVATSIDVGWFSASPYSIGIRASDGGLDFAGDTWFSIKDDIKKAGLTNVRDIAAGPDRAIAITAGGGIWVFGEQTGWHTQYAGPPNTRFGTYTTISAALPTDDGNCGVFIATTGVVGRSVTRTPTSVIATTSRESPFTAAELDQWRTEVMAASAPDADRRVVGMPVMAPTLDPIVGYGMKVDANGYICQFIGRAKSESDVAPVHDLLTAWAQGSVALDAYLDRTYPFDPDHKLNHDVMVHAVTHEPDNMTTVWTATVVSSGAPGGLTVGQYSLDRLIANENWTIYALETEVMPIPGAQAFKSGYVNAQTTVTHWWDGTFAKYDRIFSVPLESTDHAETTIYGSLALGEHTDYHYQYSQSKASMSYQGGNETARHPTTSWQLAYAATDPAGYRGDVNPISVIAVKNPPAPTPKLLILGTIGTSSDFTTGGLTSSLTVAPLQLNVIAGVV